MEKGTGENIVNIIEKLGIEPIDLDDYENVDHAIEKPIRELEQQNREMLEIIIKHLDLNQRGYFLKQKISKNIIEKACHPLKWEEIKEFHNG